MNRSCALFLYVALSSAGLCVASPAVANTTNQLAVPATRQNLYPVHSAAGTQAIRSAAVVLPTANLVLQLDGADSSTFTQTNGRLSQWRDKSGAGNSVNQPTGAAQPTVVGGALNGLSNISFDGSNSYMLSGSSFTHDLYPASTTFVVASGVSSSATTSAVWSGGNIGGYPRWAYGIPSYYAVKLFFGGSNDQLTYPTSINVASPAIYDGGESTSTQQGFINYNGSQVGSISGNITGDGGSYPLSVGARYQPSPAQAGSFYKGQVAEVLVYNALLSTAQLQQVEGYLACKWGLQGNLPANHPYRNSCSGAPPPPTAIDVDTYHNDNLRTGWNPNETALTQANVGSPAFRSLMNIPVDGLTFTQPLIAAGEPIAGAGTHDLLITGTNNDTLYAFDANTGATIWKKSFVGNGVTTVGIAYTGCDNTGQQDGILSTPVIDRATDTVYVVAATMEPHHIHFRLHALSLSSGQDKVPNVEIGGSTFSPDVQYQRPALLESNGNIYIGFGSQCDFNAAGNAAKGLSPYHGWMFAYNAANFAQIGSINITPNAQPNNQYAAGIWMSGDGPASDGSNIYFSTGNGTFDNSRNFGESVLRLPSNLSLNGMSSFTPYTALSDNSHDQDLGSGGVMLFPSQSSGAHLAVAQGKDGILFLLNRDNLGGYVAGGPDRPLAQMNIGYLNGTPAYWEDASGNPYVFTSGGSDGTGGTGGPLRSLAVANSNRLSSVGATSLFFPADNGAGTIPSISSNGRLENSAIVWVVHRVLDVTKHDGYSNMNYLYAYPANNLGKVLFAANLGGWPQNDLNPTFVPTVANGKVYVPTQNSIAVFSLH